MKRLFSLLLLPVLLLAACHSVPDHAKYIPKGATAVVGIDLKALGRKIAWSKITGSSMLDELERGLKRNGGNGSLKDLEQSGVKTGTTLYAFVSQATGDATGRSTVVTAVLPLDDAGTWEAYLKKTFPALSVAAGPNGRKEARLNETLFAAWNSEVAFLRNGYMTPGAYVMQADSTEIWQDGAPDTARSLAELRTLFDGKKETSVAGDTRFADLQKEGDDVSLWVNYDALMSRNAAATGMMLGSMGANLWKDAVLAGGFNFEKGRVAMAMRYYTPEALKEAYTEMGKGSVSRAMLDKAPGDGLGLLAAWHLSPQGLRMLLDKMGMLGLVNMGLSAQGLSMDDVLEGLSGDMLVAMNHFRVVPRPGMDSLSAGASYEPDFEYTIALGIGKKEKFDKLLGFLTGRQLLRQVAPNTYAGATGPSGVLVVDGGYAVIAKDAAAAQAYLAGKGGALPEAARKVAADGPTALYADVQTLLAGVDPRSLRTPREATVYAEVRKCFASLHAGGGRFQNGAITGEGALELVNKEENALIQLLGFASRMQALRSDSANATAMALMP